MVRRDGSALMDWNFSSKFFFWARVEAANVSDDSDIVMTVGYYRLPDVDGTPKYCRNAVEVPCVSEQRTGLNSIAPRPLINNERMAD